MRKNGRISPVEITIRHYCLSARERKTIRELTILIAEFEGLELKEEKRNTTQTSTTSRSECYSESLDVIPTEEATKHDSGPPHSTPLTKSTVAATQVVNKPIENGTKRNTVDKI